LGRALKPTTKFVMFSKLMRMLYVHNYTANIQLFYIYYVRMCM